MRELRFTLEAKGELARQLDYLVGEGAVRAAQILLDRVERFLSATLLEWPGTGRFIRIPAYGRVGFRGRGWSSGTPSTMPGWS